MVKCRRCGPENSILEHDIEVAARQETLEKLTVLETAYGWYVIVELRWAKKEWILTTRRERDMPKLFRDLSRLNVHLRELVPSMGFELVRNADLPVGRKSPKAERARKG